MVEEQADILLYGNAERAIVELAHRLADGKSNKEITDIRGTAYLRQDTPEGYTEIDSSRIDRPGRVESRINPYINTQEITDCEKERRNNAWLGVDESGNPLEEKRAKLDRTKTVIRLPAFEKVRNDAILDAHASRVLHLETNPHNARALVQKHGERIVWLNPPPIPLTTKEMDRLFALPYTRLPHTSYEGKKIPAYEMIRFSINIMRGCFGGCTFCSITEHEGRIIQNRSEDSIIQEIETIRDTVPGFTGIISDLGGPTANMYRLARKKSEIEAACRKPSCVYPGMCQNLGTDHSTLVTLI